MVHISHMDGGLEKKHKISNACKSTVVFFVVNLYPGLSKEDFSQSILTLILPEMFLASVTMGLAISMSWSRSSKALLICVSVALARASIDRSMPLMPERMTRREEAEVGACGANRCGCCTDWEGCAGA